jgi:hypothetical protein
MRQKFDLDLKELNRFSVLFHGAFGSGKTHLLGDMLRTERERGLSDATHGLLAGEETQRRNGVRFLNIAGEDGHLSIANFGLGMVGETVDTYRDFLDALNDYRKENLRALAVDGGKWYGKLCIKDVCGERLPKVGGNSDDWTQIHSRFENGIGMMRSVAPIVVMASSSDRSMDQISGDISLTPDMPGRQAAGIAGMFDFVLVVRSVAIGPGKVRRWIDTAPVSNTIIRQRLPQPLPSEIPIPENGGGWKNLIDAMQASLVKNPNKAR